MKLNYLVLQLSIFAIAPAFQAHAQPVATPPFRLKIEKFERRSVTANDVAEGYETQLVAVLGGEGTPPDWWDDHSFYSSSLIWGTSKLFYQSAEKSRPVPVGKSFPDKVSNWTPVWNAFTRQHEARYLFNLSDLPPSKERIVLRGKISLSDFSRSKIESGSPQDSVVSFAYGVRGSGQIVAPIRVSRDPKVDITRVKIEKLDAPQFENSHKYDTLVRILVHDRNSAAPYVSLQPGYPKLVDEKGRQIPLKYHWFPVSDMGKSQPPQLAPEFRFLLSAIPATQKNIYIDTIWSPHDDWPLHLRIPLRRNGRDLSGLLDPSQYTAAPAQGH